MLSDKHACLLKTLGPSPLSPPPVTRAVLFVIKVAAERKPTRLLCDYTYKYCVRSK